MNPEIGHYALVLALALALLQSVLGPYGARVRDAALLATNAPLAYGQMIFVMLGFGVLAFNYALSDFSVENVYQNSHSLQPFIYRLTSIWGNHEGSMVLWVLILVICSGLVAYFGRHLPPTLKANVLGVQAMLASAFLLFILLTSNPFNRLMPAPIEGRDLNPILQDPGLAIHPPLLYLGYVGFSVAFSFAIAALIEGRLDAAWARWVRPWTLGAWIFLTLGISMGSYWAYYELGWGGWWFWDPVENASLMPWLAGTALLHSAIVMEKREALKVWTVLLAILAFSLSLLGTFLVRSGVLTSVHTFAADPSRGTFILGILCVFIGGSLTLFALRANTLRQGGLFAPISREGALVLNNLFLSACTATVFVGTLYPMVLEALTGDKISVGAPYFNLTFGPLVLPILIAMPYGSLLAWKRGDLMGVTQRLKFAILGALIVMGATMVVTKGGPVLAAFGFGLAVFVILGSVIDLAERVALFRAPFATTFARAKGLPGSAWGTAIAHAGVGVMILGVVGESAWNTEVIARMRMNDTVSVAGYQVTYQGATSRKGPNYNEMIGNFEVRDGGRVIAHLDPRKRIYTTRNMPTSEAALHAIGATQIYISLGDTFDDDSLNVRLYHKPLVLLIWLGTLVMVLGGTLSLLDRRLRVGAPKPAAAKVRAQQEKLA